MCFNTSCHSTTTFSAVQAEMRSRGETQARRERGVRTHTKVRYVSRQTIVNQNPGERVFAICVITAKEVNRFSRCKSIRAGRRGLKTDLPECGKHVIVYVLVFACNVESQRGANAAHGSSTHMISHTHMHTVQGTCIARIAWWFLKSTNFLTYSTLSSAHTPKRFTLFP